MRWRRSRGAERGYDLGTWKEHELVQHVRTNAGAEGAGAQAELTRRMIVSMRSATRLTWSLVGLTIALLGVAVWQIIVARN